jgi:hypothetical protein
VVHSLRLRDLLGLRQPRQVWHRPAGSAWQTRCGRCGRMGRMVEVRWLFVLTRLQCGRGQGCQKARKAAPIVDRVPRPREVSSRQVARTMAHDRLSRERRSASKAEVAALVAEGRRVAQGLDAKTRRRMGL